MKLLKKGRKDDWKSGYKDGTKENTIKEVWLQDSRGKIGCDLNKVDTCWNKQKVPQNYSNQI